tara:strand:+ start:622 stop:774 length:153 start_codon:yes stop_codon:yes gene_type:complete
LIFSNSSDSYQVPPNSSIELNMEIVRRESGLDVYCDYVYGPNTRPYKNVL